MSQANLQTPWGDVPIGGDDIDTLIIRFWKDSPGPAYQGPPVVQPFAAQIGPDPIAGICGFGPTPLAALRDLVEQIAQHADEDHRTDNNRLALR
jgi:hypothetical protein